MMTLTAAQLRDALELCNPDGPEDAEQAQTEVTLFYRETAKPDQEEAYPIGWYCWLTDCPEAGVYGPLGLEPK